jgi:threonine-phosphate decarboxylase
VEPAPVVDFSVNLNPLGCPGLVRSRWKELMEGIDRYPSLEGEGIARYLRERLDLGGENVLGANGSTEMIYLLPRALGLQRVAVVSPCYHDYHRASLLAGAQVRRIPLAPEAQFRPPSAARLSAAMAEADALWLGNPNNPTGTFLPRAFLSDLAGRFPETWLIVDEAFMPFDPAWREESLALPPLLPNVIVIHSLTKFYGLAGLRLGGVSASPQVIERLRRFKEPWTVNSVSEALAPLLLSCADYDGKTRRFVAEERSRLCSALEGVDGLAVFPSRANFLLCRWDREPDLDSLLRRLLARGIYVRDCRNFPGLEGGYFRVAVRTREDNDRLVQELASPGGG